jgi:hypothetical protein
MLIACGFMLFSHQKKPKSDRNRPKSEKERENEQCYSGHIGTLFGCAFLSPNVEMKTFELLEYPTYLLSLPFLLPSLEALLSSWASALLASSFSSNDSFVPIEQRCRERSPSFSSAMRILE